MSEIIRGLAGTERIDPNLIVGFETGDDAGVYRLSDGLALVQSVDYITPVVDDPYLFGQVAAANSLSDIYAMGGRPVTAMNLCNFPARGIDLADLRRIIEGSHTKIREAGAVLVGGHSVRDDELKYGLSVTGLIDPRRVVTNAGARGGDSLVLTKPIGTGVIVNGFRRGQAPEALLMRAVEWMTALNRRSCELMLELGAHACTDITGFGLAGHALGMARASAVRLRIRYDDIPRYTESLDLIRRGVTTVVTASIEQTAREHLVLSGAFKPEETGLLFDPQTSGGLLIALPADRGPELVRRLRSGGNGAASVVGEAVPAAAGGFGLEIYR